MNREWRHGFGDSSHTPKAPEAAVWACARKSKRTRHIRFVFAADALFSRRRIGRCGQW